MSEIAIRVRGLGKVYRIFDKPQDRLKQMFAWNGTKYYRDFAGLSDVSFDVRRGEALGVIGRNGQGKSTLLQILAGTMRATSGVVEVSGRVGALLELGAGFDPEFTGRENVLFSGMLHGTARAQVMARMPQIIEFAEIGDFIDQPVKTYSTGMFVRLAFSTHIFQEPEILIVDEALSVGDVFFQQKCFAKIRQMRDDGLTLVLVSHDMAAIRNVCDRALLLREGRVAFEGPPEEVVSRFYDFGAPVRIGAREEAPHGTAPRRMAVEIRDALMQGSILHASKQGHGSGGLAIEAVTYENESGERSLLTLMRGTVRICVLIKASQDVPAPSVGIHLYDRMNNLVFACGTRQLDTNLPPLRAGDEIAVAMDLTLNVQQGLYTFSIGCSEPSADGPNYGVNLDRREGLGPIVVHVDESRMLPFYGIAELPMSIRMLG